MPEQQNQLTKGGRAAITLIQDHLAAIRIYATECRQAARRNPMVAEDAANDIIDLTRLIDDVLSAQVEPILQRRSGREESDILRRLQALESKVEELQRRSADGASPADLRLVK